MPDNQIVTQIVKPKNSPLRANAEKYSDFFNNMVINPVTGDLAKTTNEDAVRQSIKNLIFTGRGERPFQPNLGSDVFQMLFENITTETIAVLKSMIEDTIVNFEPRAELLRVEVNSLVDTNDLKVRIVFRVINTDTIAEVTTQLTRIR